ncbi:MAG: HIT family protein, partial [Acidobacteria bacterium]|nr:HIT family protein [Acidobacteriota bacterium]
LPEKLIDPFFRSVQLLARAVEAACDAEGSFVAMNNRVSQSVPHLHVHIVPRRKKDGLKGFFWPRTKYENEAQLLEVKQSIQSAIARLRKQ